MRSKSLAFSLVVLLFCFSLLLLGLFLLLLPLSPLLYRALLKMIESPLFIIWLGVVILAWGSLFLALFSTLFRRSYWIFEMGGRQKVLIEACVFQRIALDFFKELFPNEKVSCEIHFRKRGCLEIVADIPYVPFEQREGLLSLIEKKLEGCFLHWCGYRNQFFLNIQFCE